MAMLALQNPVRARHPSRVLRIITTPCKISTTTINICCTTTRVIAYYYYQRQWCSNIAISSAISFTNASNKGKSGQFPLPDGGIRCVVGSCAVCLNATVGVR